MAQTGEPQNAFMVAIKDIFAGTVAGIGQCFVGHPLDTIKVRLQTSDKYAGTVDCFKTTVKEEGLLGLYKGVQSPLVGMAALNSVTFLSYGQAKAFLKKDENDQLSISQILGAGLFVGLTVAFVECPVDLFKSQLQTQYGTGTPKYNGFIDCATKIWRNHGLRGIYQGFSATLLRDIPANAAYFGAYEIARRNMVQPGQDVAQLPAWKVLIAGGIGGMSYWATTFPFDVVKSKIQTDSTNVSERKYHGLGDAFAKIYKAEGANGFWKGITPCMLRSFPANAVCFLLYELTRQYTG
eukprot:TRINITY_DN2184_c0_g1_i1.p1 TRINITY_DN2184_c0_g1~~TRINITY_DN2184_c0_g1_i1.p1  ORF type:complete len:295 (+),score=42.26 TRINITY_DN2184_c0_g1_i1:158-1042(+)